MSTFFEQIPVEQLVSSVGDLIPRDRMQDCAGTLDLLRKCLLWCSRQGLGIPQNYDPSSFFGSAYLAPIDREMCRLEGIRYFRWMDDIRFTARTRGEAIRHLHLLQDGLARLGLSVNAKKTRLIEPNSSEYATLLSIDEDHRLDELAGMLSTMHEDTIRNAIPLFADAIKRCNEKDDDRFLRAYGGRLLEAAQLVEVRDDCLAAIREYALQGFLKRPERADSWARFLLPDVNSRVQEFLVEFLQDPNFNCHQWTNMWAVTTLSQASDPSTQTVEYLRRVVEESPCAPVRAYALVALGRVGDNIDRARIGDAYITGETHPLVRRAAVVAIQELRSDARERFFGSAGTIDPDLAVLCEYIMGCSEPQYGIKKLPTRHCLPTPAALPDPEHTAFGFIGGEWRSFGVRARSYAGYE
ncbi:MAG: RNA-directed DNA polymerase [bacterium]|nr:RNA-directed DNA polymerase [bacterium]